MRVIALTTLREFWRKHPSTLPYGEQAILFGENC